MNSVALPIHPAVIKEELDNIDKILQKWRKRFDNALPGVDVPTSDAEAKLDLILREFTGELLFIGGKCSNMALILSER